MCVLVFRVVCCVLMLFVSYGVGLCLLLLVLSGIGRCQMLVVVVWCELSRCCVVWRVLFAACCFFVLFFLCARVVCCYGVLSLRVIGVRVWLLAVRCVAALCIMRCVSVVVRCLSCVVC